MRYYTSMSRLREALGRRILVLDGAMGTMLQAADLDAIYEYLKLKSTQPEKRVR